MTEKIAPFLRLAATIVVVANAASLAVLALADDSGPGVLIALGAATVGPLLIALTNTQRTTWVLAAFVTVLIGIGVAFGDVGLGEAAGPTLLLALVVALLVCVAGTLVQAQASLDEPRNRF
jgi:hypothetical protein